MHISLDTLMILYPEYPQFWDLGRCQDGYDPMPVYEAVTAARTQRAKDKKRGQAKIARKIEQGGKVYVLASVAAQKVGLTSDQIGYAATQAKKVDHLLVGEGAYRRLYVDMISVRAWKEHWLKTRGDRDAVTGRKAR